MKRDDTQVSKASEIKSLYHRGQWHNSIRSGKAHLCERSVNKSGLKGVTDDGSGIPKECLDVDRACAVKKKLQILACCFDIVNEIWRQFHRA